jgi:MFS family permease
MFSPAYKRYVLAALTTLFTVNLFDQGMVALLLQPIKEDLQLSDTQLGFLTGIAFALIYATVGIPLGRWADRGNRVTIISLTLGLWALTNMAFVLVTSFVQLLLLRIVAAVGDAGCKPLTYSLLGDYFPERAERTRAMYVWYLANPLAALISWMAAGWLNERYGWRLTFLAAGLLGWPLALLARWTLIEPRSRLDAAATSERLASVPPLRAVFALLWRQASCRHLALALILTSLVGYGVGTWQSAFMIRQHGIGTAELGVWMGLIGGGVGALSILLGRYVVGRWFAERDRAQMLLAAAALFSGAPIFLAFLISPTKQLSLIALMLQAVVFGAFMISPYVMLQRLVPDEMRATMLMVVLFLMNLIGMGIGPLIVGSLSDVLTAAGSDNGLRSAMMVMTMGYVCASYHFVRVAGSIDADLRQATQGRNRGVGQGAPSSERADAVGCEDPATRRHQPERNLVSAGRP